MIYHLRAGPEKNAPAIEGLKQLEPTSDYESRLENSIDKLLQIYCVIREGGIVRSCYTDEVNQFVENVENVENVKTASYTRAYIYIISITPLI